MINHEKLQLSKKGVRNFYWPINRHRMTNFIRSLIKDSVLFFKNNHANENDKLLKKLKLTNSFFILKVSHLYQKKLLQRGIDNPIDNNLDLSVFNNKLLIQEYDGYLFYLKNGFREELTKKYRFPSFRRYLATLIRNDGFIRESVSHASNREAIICTGVSPLASEYAKSINKKKFLIKISEFFSNTSKELINIELISKKDSVILSKIYADYIDIFRNILSEDSIELEDIDIREIDNWHKEFFVCLDFYQKKLDTNSNIPNELWTGSAGILWNKMLAMEVRKRGGRVTVFDHAHGANLSTDSIMPFLELQELDLFVTHSKIFVEYFKENALSYLYSNNIPDIITPG
ncbi:hypothetical protein OAR80_02040 [Methylophilaceae bacterium]|nr:hypothetical protein [Methylophilaceae bacterium]